MKRLIHSRWKQIATALHHNCRVYACMLSYFSCVWLCVTLWTVVCQVPLSMGFSRQQQWSGLPFPSPRDLPNPKTESESLLSPALAGWFFTTSVPYALLQEIFQTQGSNLCLLHLLHRQGDSLSLMPPGSHTCREPSINVRLQHYANQKMQMSMLDLKREEKKKKKEEEWEIKLPTFAEL